MDSLFSVSRICIQVFVAGGTSLYLSQLKLNFKKGESNFAQYIRSIFLLSLLSLFPSLTPAFSEDQSGSDFKIDVTPYRRPKDIPFRIKDKINDQQLKKLISLGKYLFFDPRLSKNGLMSCATCHNPSFYWTDGLKVSVENVSRRSMALFNLAWDLPFTWSGTKRTLADQIPLPIMAPLGMNSNEEIINQRLSAISFYRELYGEALKGIDPKPGTFGMDGVSLALEAYVSTIVSPIAPFDRWVEGDSTALNDQQVKGFRLFTGKAGCIECHKTWNFTQSKLQDIGLSPVDDKGPGGFGPYYKVVGLRNIADRPPYMHDGRYSTLAEVVDFYNRGGDVQRATKSPFIKPLNLTTEESDQIIEFLRSLSGEMEPLSYLTLPR